ncbi:MAG: recombinase family protein [Bacteroidetes bacterium]|nr:recombinase family protein [Bacteroidota bacterium]
MRGSTSPDWGVSITGISRIKEINVINVFIEDYSAKNFDRPEFTKLLNYIKHNKSKVDELLFIKWDRFSRNTSDSYAMIDNFKTLGVIVNAVEQPIDLSIPENKIMLAFYLTSPEVENDRRSINTRNGMRQAMKEGYWQGSPPKGYSYTGTKPKNLLIPNDDAQFIKKAFELVSLNTEPVDKIRVILNKEGAKFTKTAFYNLLQNISYTGQIFIKSYGTEKSEIVSGLHDPIISIDLYKKAQLAIHSRKRTIKSKSKYDNNLPLRGHLICNECGKILTGSASSNRVKNKYYYYHCQNGCKQRFSAQSANSIFIKYLQNLQLNSNMKKLIFEIIKDLSKNNNKDNKIRLLNYEKKINTIDNRLQALVDSYLDGNIRQDVYDKVQLKYENEKSDIIEVISKIKRTERDIQNIVNFGIIFFEEIHNQYVKHNVEIKHRIIGSIFNNNLIFNGKSYRTPVRMPYLSLLFNNINEFGEVNKKRAAISSNPSMKAPPPGLEPGTY